MRRTVQLRVAGQTHRVVTTATDGELKRFVATIEDRLHEVSPRGRRCIRKRCYWLRSRWCTISKKARALASDRDACSRGTLAKLVERIDAALDAGEDAEDPSPTGPDREARTAATPERGSRRSQRRTSLAIARVLSTRRRAAFICARTTTSGTARLAASSNTSRQRSSKMTPLAPALRAWFLGKHQAHRALEIALADWLHTEESLIFTSGYAANVGTIAALAEAGDLIVSDSLNHASIIDGCRLSRAEVVVVRHNDVGEIARALRGSRARRRLGRHRELFQHGG